MAFEEYKHNYNVGDLLISEKNVDCETVIIKRYTIVKVIKYDTCDRFYTIKDVESKHQLLCTDVFLNWYFKKSDFLRNNFMKMNKNEANEYAKLAISGNMDFVDWTVSLFAILTIIIAVILTLLNFISCISSILIAMTLMIGSCTFLLLKISNRKKKFKKNIQNKRATVKCAKIRKSVPKKRTVQVRIRMGDKRCSNQIKK